MIQRLFIEKKNQDINPLAKAWQAFIEENSKGVVHLRHFQSYFIEASTDIASLNTKLSQVFVDPVCDQPYINQLPKLGEGFFIEIHYKQGVTDNVAKSAHSGLLDGIGSEAKDWKLLSAQSLFLQCSLSIEALSALIAKEKYNPLIQTCRIYPVDKAFSYEKIAHDPFIRSETDFDALKYIDLSGSDQELLDISDKMVLALSLEEMRAIREYIQGENAQKRRRELGLEAKISQVELEVLAQTWSEHCKHKIFAADIDYKVDGKQEKIDGLFKNYIKKVTDELMSERPDLLSVFVDNAGVVAFEENMAYCLKAETHNSPSALDPYGGAMTGIVGVNRDILGTGDGARPIFNTDVFCFGPPDYKKPLPSKLLHPLQIFHGVHRGVKDGGNESGIPTINGAMVFDERFIGKPLVFCGTAGVLPITVDGHDNVNKDYKAGDYIVMAGGRIGKDGIHGATFSSAALTETSPTSAVQIGDPITQKKMTEFIIEARDLGYIESLTDNGAGGLSSSVGEMAELTNGCILHLEKAPLKYKGLEPWEILLSEAQERMTLAVKPDTYDKLKELADVYEVEVSHIGEFSDSGFFEAFYHEQCLCSIAMHFLHEGLPKMQLKAEWTPPLIKKQIGSTSDTDLKADLLSLLKRPNIASKEYWVRQYDHEVQGNTVLKPFDGEKYSGPNDAGVVRLSSEHYRGLAVSNGLMPRLSDYDSFVMAQASVDEALRNLICSGADPATWTGLDNFCWPDPVESPDNPDAKYKMAQLVRCNQGLYEACKHYKLPLISGKDSMKNDYGKGRDRISIPPTLLVTAAGIVPDTRKCLTSALKGQGNTLVYLGRMQSAMGASEYYKEKGWTDSEIFTVNLEENLERYKALFKLLKEERLLSIHDVSDGGLLCAAAEMCIGGQIGAYLNINNLSEVYDFESNTLLFNEAPGSFLLEIEAQELSSLQSAFPEKEVIVIGETSASKLLELKSINGSTVWPLEELEDAFCNTLNYERLSHD